MRKLILLFLFVLPLNELKAQPPAAAPSSSDSKKVNPWPSIDSPLKAESFISLEGRFKIKLPSNVQGYSGLSPKDTGTNATGQRFTWKFAEGDVIAFYLEDPQSLATGTATVLASLITRAKARFVEKFPGAKLVSEGESKSATLPYGFFVYNAGLQGFIAFHYFLSGTRIYQFNVVYKDRAVEDRFNQVIGSFEVLSQADIDASIARKFEELKPPPLPQTPPIPRLTSDAQDAGLKGKVKRIVEEDEDQSGTWSAQGRKLSSVVEYAEDGSLIQRDAYDYRGNPFQITVYGYLDGKRVSNSKITRYEYDPPPMAAPAASKGQPVPKRDSRYEYSFEYKYENGKLVERQLLYNDGKKGMRYVYKHSLNAIEELVYSEDGKLNQRYLSLLDDKGNVIERTDFGIVNHDIYGDRKYKYTYEFDTTGNWIKKFASKEVTENGVTKLQPAYIELRTITYY